MALQLFTNEQLNYVNRQETRSYINCLEEVRSGVASLEGKIDNLKCKMDQDQTGINLL